MEYLRDYCMYASIFGFFSCAWFGWAQENPRANWRKYLGMASGAALLVCLLGVYLSITNWNEASALSDTNVFRQYLIFFYLEFIVGGIGAWILTRKKRKAFIAPWIALVVGVHFIGLKYVFDDAGLFLLAGLLIAISGIAIYTAPKLKVAYSAVTGIGSGIILFAYAILGLIRYWSV